MRNGLSQPYPCWANEGLYITDRLRYANRLLHTLSLSGNSGPRGPEREEIVGGVGGIAIDFPA